MLITYLSSFIFHILSMLWLPKASIWWLGFWHFPLLLASLTVRVVAEESLLLEREPRVVLTQLMPLAYLLLSSP
jgi:hypothetical protein